MLTLTTLVTQIAKSQILGTSIVNNVTLLVSLAQVLTLFSAFPVTIQTTNFMIEVQSALKLAGMANYLAIMIAMTEISTLMTDVLMTASMNRVSFAFRELLILQQFARKSAEMGGRSTTHVMTETRRAGMAVILYVMLRLGIPAQEGAGK